MEKTYLERLASETVFLENVFEEAAVKSNPDPLPSFVKFRNGKEFKARPGSVIVTDARLEGKEITEAEYDTY